MSRLFVILSLLSASLIFVTGCSTSEVFKPTGAESNPEVSRDQRKAIVSSEGISIEAKLAREENGRFRVNLVVDNHSEMTIDFSMGDTHLYLNGTDLKVHSSNFLRNWSYQSASRGTFAPGESAYAQVAFESDSTPSLQDKLELWIDGIIDSRSGRKVAFPKIAFGDAVMDTSVPARKPTQSESKAKP